jgi:hypothetical protein
VRRPQHSSTRAQQQAARGSPGRVAGSPLHQGPGHSHSASDTLASWAAVLRAVLRWQGGSVVHGAASTSHACRPPTRTAAAPHTPTHTPQQQRPDACTMPRVLQVAHLAQVHAPPAHQPEPPTARPLTRAQLLPPAHAGAGPVH